MSKDEFDIYFFATSPLGHFLLGNSRLPFMDKHRKIIVVGNDMHNPPVKEGENFKGLGVEIYCPSQ